MGNLAYSVELNTNINYLDVSGMTILLILKLLIILLILILFFYHGSKLNAVLRNSRVYSNLLAERLDLTLTLSMRSVLATFPPTTSAASASRWSQRHILARFMPMALINDMCHAELCLSIGGRSNCYRAHSRHARSMHCASQATMLLLAPVQVYWTYGQTGFEFCFFRVSALQTIQANGWN